MSKIIVTGGKGFIGSYLANSLAEKGEEVLVIDNLSGGKDRKLNENINFHNIDIRNYDKLEDVFKNVDYVFHLAALPRVQFSIDEPIESNSVNIDGTLNVLVASQKNNIKRVIFASSSSIYGDGEKTPYTEDMNPSPLSPYALHKLTGEYYCRLFNNVYGLSTVSLRYFNVYGPGFDPSGAYALVIGKFIDEKLKGNPMPITGDGEQSRDFTHLKDVVEANIKAMESSKVGLGEVINIGNGKDVSVNKIAELIKGEKKYIDARLEPRITKADNELAKRLLGWEPVISIEEGIKKLKKQYEV